MESSPFISVIIPAVNEAALLPRALNHLRAESVTHEIVVPVGPSYDGTASLAEAGGCVVIESPDRHRARQMNLGAARARGEVLLFLHADSVLPEGALERIADAPSTGMVNRRFRGKKSATFRLGCSGSACSRISFF